ncbi:MAG TPA: hypothetical protein VIG88_14000 [Lysobacter sp.]
MQSTSGITPATAPRPADPATGAGAQATTRTEVLWARIHFFEAQRDQHRAQATVQDALIHSYAVDPSLPAPERLILTECAQFEAQQAREAAELADGKAIELRGQLPRGEAQDACAIGVVTIQRDRIVLTAKLVMGGTHTVTREWTRLESGGWRSRGPEFITAEERLGVEFAEWMDSIDVPGRVATMLPRRPSPTSTAAADAAREVRHG